MRQQRALRPPGGARGEQDQGRVVLVDVDVGVWDLAGFEEVGSLVDVDDRDVGGDRCGARQAAGVDDDGGRLRQGDRVLDPFCGSGSTGVAALETGRNFLGNDLGEAAIELSRERLLAAGGEEIEGEVALAATDGQLALGL